MFQLGRVVHTCGSSTQGLRHEDHKFKASLGYIIRLSSEEKQRKS